jgi:hypothetical protein
MRGDFGIFILKTAENLSRIQKSSISLLFFSGMGSATLPFPERNKALQGGCRRLEILLSYETLSSFPELYQEKKKDFNLTSTGTTYQLRD